MILQSMIAVALALIAAAIAAAPVVLQKPFGAQTPTGMWLAHGARTWGTPLTIGLAVVTIALVLSAARGARGWARALLAVPVAAALAAAWFARQNPFEWWFNALGAPSFVAARQAAAFVEPGDLVLAVTADGESAAYPVRLIAYHHIVNDRVGRTPAVVTY